MIFGLAAADRTFVVPVAVMICELPVAFRRKSRDQRTNDFANHTITIVSHTGGRNSLNTSLPVEALFIMETIADNILSNTS